MVPPQKRNGFPQSTQLAASSTPGDTWPCSISLHYSVTINFPILLFMDIWVASNWGLLWRILLRIVCPCYFGEKKMHSSFGNIPVGRAGRSYEKHTFNFGRNDQTAFQSGCTILHAQQQWKSPSCSNSWQHFVLSYIFLDTILVPYNSPFEVYKPVVFRIFTKLWNPHQHLIGEHFC